MLTLRSLAKVTHHVRLDIGGYILPSGMRLAILTLKYPVPAPMSATIEVRFRCRASKIASGFCQASLWARSSVLQ
jgi:hypothetical protein